MDLSAQQILQEAFGRWIIIGNIDVAVRSDTVCQLAWCAFHLRRKRRWDPAQELSLNDPDAHRMQIRHLRAPWRL